MLSVRGEHIQRTRWRLLGLTAMWTYIAIAIGGAIGCWARYAQGNIVNSLLGESFPFGTLSINAIGSFLMGYLYFETQQYVALSTPLRVGVLTGFLGGYTTFSTYSLDFLLLAEHGELTRATLYFIASTLLGFGGVIAGAWVARAL